MWFPGGKIEAKFNPIYGTTKDLPGYRCLGRFNTQEQFGCLMKDGPESCVCGGSSNPTTDLRLKSWYPVFLNSVEIRSSLHNSLLPTGPNCNLTTDDVTDARERRRQRRRLGQVIETYTCEAVCSSEATANP
ncbi:unnamed protein product [Dicrocoelium dendriticum]|nr:unnamed protein product [Dicrocoelium dendriticum]